MQQLHFHVQNAHFVISPSTGSNWRPDNPPLEWVGPAGANFPPLPPPLLRLPPDIEEVPIIAAVVEEVPDDAGPEPPPNTDEPQPEDVDGNAVTIDDDSPLDRLPGVWSQDDANARATAKAASKKRLRARQVEDNRTPLPRRRHVEPRPFTVFNHAAQSRLRTGPFIVQRELSREALGWALRIRNALQYVSEEK